MIGARDDAENQVRIGSAYFYEWDGNAWQERQKIFPDGDADGFGATVEVQGEFAMVQARMPGAIPVQNEVHVYRLVDDTWLPIQKISAPDSTTNYQKRTFGMSISMYGDVAFIAATEDNGSGVNGKVFVYLWSGETWENMQTLTVEGTTSRYGFGYQVSVFDQVAFIGDPSNSTEADTGGAVDVFQRTDDTWEWVQTLYPSDAQTNLAFGTRVALHKGVAAIGAWGDGHGGTLSGSVYVFRKQNDLWIEEQKLIDENGRAFDSLGSHWTSMAIT